MTQENSALRAQKQPDLFVLLDDDTEFSEIPWEMALVTVTPGLAKKWLALHNDGNRKLKPDHVNKLAKALTDGSFQTTPQGISFTPEGHLLDGQHRLQAIVQSNVSLDVAVFFGVSTKTFIVFDSISAIRTVSDIVKTSGIADVHAATVGAAYKLLRNWSNEKLNAGPGAFLSNTQLVVMNKEHPDLVDLVLGAKKLATSSGIPAATLMVSRYLIDSSRPDVDSRAFWEKLGTGANLAADSPILALRNFVLTRKAKRPILDQTEWVSAIMKAWLAWSEDRGIKILRFSRHENRPVLVPPTNEYAPPRPDILAIRMIDLIEKGLIKPGTVLRSHAAMYQEKATVLEDGRLDCDGNIYDTPDAAAGAVRNGLTIGWTFWHLPEVPGDEPVPLAHLRQEYLVLRRIEANKAS